MNTISLKIILEVALISLSINACASAPRFTSGKNSVEDSSETIFEDLSRYENYKVLETQIGTASFYADKYHGKITYGGDVYDMNGVSAAHPTYPMNTIIRVTNLENEKNIILRINDKMPQWPDRIIDLSLGAARELDFVGNGLVNVKVEVLEWGNGRK